MKGLLASRKFWAVVFDMAITLTVYFVAKYIPQAAEDVKFVIAVIQVPFAGFILGTAWEDSSEKGNKAVELSEENLKEVAAYIQQLPM